MEKQGFMKRKGYPAENPTVHLPFELWFISLMESPLEYFYQALFVTLRNFISKELKKHPIHTTCMISHCK